MTLTHYIGGKLVGLTADFPPSLNYPNLTTFINQETFAEFILVNGVWQLVGQDFSPLLLPNLVGWWDASDNSTMTPSSGNITTWADKSGNGHDFVAGSSPVLVSADRNGLDVLDFVSSKYMNSTFSTISLPFTIYMVAVAPLNNGQDRHFYDATTSLDAGSYKSGTTDRFIMTGNGATLEFTKTGFVNNWNYMTHVWAVSPNGQYRMNGVDEATSNALITATMDGMRVEARGDISSFGNTKVGELVVQDGLATAQEIADMEVYMSVKWGF